MFLSARSREDIECGIYRWVRSIDWEILVVSKVSHGVEGIEGIVSLSVSDSHVCATRFMSFFSMLMILYDWISLVSLLVVINVAMAFVIDFIVMYPLAATAETTLLMEFLFDISVDLRYV